MANIKPEWSDCTHRVGCVEAIGRAGTLEKAEEIYAHATAHHHRMTDDTRRKLERAIMAWRNK